MPRSASRGLVNKIDITGNKKSKYVDYDGIQNDMFVNNFYSKYVLIHRAVKLLLDHNFFIRRQIVNHS